MKISCLSGIYARRKGVRMFCPNCGKEVPDGVAFCGGCGTSLAAAAAAPAAPVQPQPAPVAEPAATAQPAPAPAAEAPAAPQPAAAQPAAAQPQPQAQPKQPSDSLPFGQHLRISSMQPFIRLQAFLKLQNSMIRSATLLCLRESLLLS